MAPRVIPVEIGDYLALADADRVYAHSAGVEPIVDKASVHYYHRSGHSFAARSRAVAGGAETAGAGDIAETGEALVGFVLAHATWSGGRPVVRVERLVTTPATAAVAKSLVEAVVKSAYDAGVYDIVAAVPHSDPLATAALTGSAFVQSAVSVYVRVLGSRGAPIVQGG